MNTPHDEGAPQAPPATIKPDDAAQPPVSVSSSGFRSALSGLGRQLRDEELDSPGARKMLLDAYDRAEAECAELRDYKSKFHEADKRAAILETKLRGVNALDILYSVSVCLGGVIIGYGPSIAGLIRPELAGNYLSMCGYVGVGLIIIACVVRIIAR